MMNCLHNNATAVNPTSLREPNLKLSGVFVFSKQLCYCSLFLWLAGCTSVKPVAMKSADTFLENMIPATVTFDAASVAPDVKRKSELHPADFVVWTADLRSDELKNSYRIVMKTSDNNITGLCILKKYGDEWRGTLINEMGAKAFDFIITDNKCELLHVISLMDKWYVKKTVATDLHFLFNVDNPKASFQKQLKRFRKNGMKVVKYRKKQIFEMPDGAVRLTNKRRNLQYELRKMVEIDRDKVIL